MNPRALPYRPAGNALGARSRSAGLTLIELMAALAIFSILGVLSYRAVSSTTESVQRLVVEFKRWHDLSQFLQMVETDMVQIVARPFAPGGQALPSPVYAPGAGGAGAQLSFLRLDGAGNAVRRRGYRLAGENVLLQRWPGIDALAPPLEDVVLENVRGLRMSFITDGGQRTASWPPDAAASARLPAAIELELDLSEMGTVRRVFALH